MVVEYEDFLGWRKRKLSYDPRSDWGEECQWRKVWFNCDYLRLERDDFSLWKWFIFLVILFTVRSLRDSLLSLIGLRVLVGSIARLVEFQSSGNFNVFSPNGRWFSEKSGEKSEKCENNHFLSGSWSFDELFDSRIMHLFWVIFNSSLKVRRIINGFIVSLIWRIKWEIRAIFFKIHEWWIYRYSCKYRIENMWVWYND